LELVVSGKAEDNFKKSLENALQCFMNVSDKRTITQDNFVTFKLLFAVVYPISPATVDQRLKYLKDICNLYNQPYFKGRKVRKEVEEIIEKATKTSNENFFLLRISGEKKAFCLDYYYDSTIKHKIINKESYWSTGIESYINSQINQYKLVSVQ